MRVGPSLVAAPVAVGPFLTAKLRALDDRLAQVAPRVLSSGPDDDAVHDLRVALRRTRTVLEIGRPAFGRFHADQVRRALRDLQRASGALRDEEVLLKLLASLRVDHGEEQAWIESRKRRENRLRGALRRMVRAGEIDRGRTLLAAMLVFPIKPSRDKRLAKCARRAVDEALRQVEEHRAARIDDAGALHQLRIAYKRLRYTVETFADALPADLVALGQAAARFQGRLGDLHDADVAIACAKRARLLSDSGRAALVFDLTRVRAQRAAVYEQELSAAAIAPAPFQVSTPVRQSRQNRENHRHAADHAVGTASLRKSSTR
jgi:CHAD domain-containing protein